MMRQDLVIAANGGQVVDLVPLLEQARKAHELVHLVDGGLKTKRREAFLRRG